MTYQKDALDGQQQACARYSTVIPAPAPGLSSDWTIFSFFSKEKQKPLSRDDQVAAATVYVFQSLSSRSLTPNQHELAESRLLSTLRKTPFGKVYQWMEPWLRSARSDDGVSEICQKFAKEFVGF
jgi:hypothetical protein